MSNDFASKSTLYVNGEIDTSIISENDQNTNRKSKDIALIAIFSAILGILAIFAWIVPFRHITMEFLINVVVILLLKIARRKGTLFFTGLITGFIDFFAGLSGPGGFLAPIVYGFKLGFLESANHYYKKPRHRNAMLIVVNSIGYFLTGTLIWIMYTALFIPLGTESTQKMWFVLTLAGALICIPATVFAINIYDRWFKPHARILMQTKT
ncbi:MAG: hypothetical protein Q6373_002825 [Candidatus Sigynarchaeota archaeon]